MSTSSSPTTPWARTATALTPIDERVVELTGWPSAGRGSPPGPPTHRLIADIAGGYDVVVSGADKWHQLLDPDWYGGAAGRDGRSARLPTVALAPRPPWALPGDDPAADPPDGVEFVVLHTDPAHHEVSATAVRSGRAEWRAAPPR